MTNKLSDETARELVEQVEMSLLAVIEFFEAMNNGTHTPDISRRFNRTMAATAEIHQKAKAELDQT